MARVARGAVRASYIVRETGDQRIDETTAQEHAFQTCAISDGSAESRNRQDRQGNPDPGKKRDRCQNTAFEGGKDRAGSEELTAATGEMLQARQSATSKGCWR